tara:strand:- start:1461 stop:2231 length:771 start_codon:yes stop_codon:yes gene_type:complete
MDTKEKIVKDWLIRYTGKSLEAFGEYILLTNFQKYITLFSEITKAPIEGKNNVMSSSTSKNITIINFGMGSPNAALIMDLLISINPKAVLFLGKCGGLKKRNNIGDFILPIGAIRGDGTSDDYLPKEVPAMPSFALQKVISTTLREHKLNYWTGTVFTTNRRVWEHDAEFKDYLQDIRAYAIDMETATLFIVGFYNQIPTGALLLVSDQPMVPEGVKSMEKDEVNSKIFDKKHIELGINSLKQLINQGETIRHLKF